MLIPDLEDGVAYTSFLNDLKSGRFKLSLVEQKETTLAAALRKAADFIWATEICVDNSDAPKKTKALGDKNSNHVTGIPIPGRSGRNLRRLTLDLPPMLGDRLL